MILPKENSLFRDQRSYRSASLSILGDHDRRRSRVSCAHHAGTGRRQQQLPIPRTAKRIDASPNRSHVLYMCLAVPLLQPSISMTGITCHAIVRIAIYTAMVAVDLVLVVVAIYTGKDTEVPRHVVTGRARVPY